MKFSRVLPLAIAVGSASAFAPQQRPAFATRTAPIFMSEETAETPAPVPESPATTPKSSALVPIKEETVEFTAGIIGGAAGFVVGGPLVAAVGAAAANYVSKMEGEAGEVVGAVSKSAIQVYNYLLGLDAKYELLKKAQGSLESALDKLKSQQSIDQEAVAKVEKALASTKAKIEEINDEYDLVGASVTALGVVGDLVEKTVKKASELNEEYQLTGKAKEALSSAVDKAKAAAK